MQCGYSNLYLYLYLHLSLYLRLYLYFIDLIFSPRPHFWHNLLFFVWILPLQKLLQVPNAQVLLQEVWQWLPWGVQLQVHPLRKRLPLLLWPLQVSVIILCYSGWHLVIRLSVCLSKVILSNPKSKEWLMSTSNFLGSSWVLIFQHWLCLVQQEWLAMRAELHHWPRLKEGKPLSSKWVSKVPKQYPHCIKNYQIVPKSTQNNHYPGTNQKYCASQQGDCKHIGYCDPNATCKKKANVSIYDDIHLCLTLEIFMCSACDSGYLESFLLPCAMWLIFPNAQVGKFGQYWQCECNKGWSGE